MEAVFETSAPNQRPLRLLVHYPVLNRGGAERSLLKLLTALAERGCVIDFVLTSAGGVLETDVDARVNVHHLRQIQTWAIGQRASIVGRFSGAVRWVLARCQEAVRRRRFFAVEYDAAFCGSAGVSPDFICNTVHARRRFVFVRNDPAEVTDHRWRVNIERFSKHIDGYLCVSDYVRRSMQATYPQVGGKCITAYNLIDAKTMRTRSQEGSNPFGSGDGKLRVLSVCRLQEVSKGLLRMVEVHRRLLDAGLVHEWHVLGDGPDRELLENAIVEHGLQDSLILHGAVANPFPWYKHADICAVLSRYEGLCGVVNEARILERPVIATRFSGIEEQIEDDVNGLIVEQNVGAICTGLTRLLQEPELRKRLAKGGYPQLLLDDGAKVEALLQLFSKSA